MSKDNKRVVREYFVELSPTITDLLEIELMDEEELIEYGMITKETLKKGKSRKRRRNKKLNDNIGE